MKNKNFYSWMNPDIIQEFSIKLREANKEHDKLLYFLDEISKYLSKVELINRELNDYEYLFEILDKKEELFLHHSKSIRTSKILDKLIERIRGISNRDIKLSFERIESVLLESKEIMDKKLQLENIFKEKK
tara:strand:+ start:2116 stop:2508 length:393 start_codon:yes stop_codon:yes gene_type:complete